MFEESDDECRGEQDCPCPMPKPSFNFKLPESHQRAGEQSATSVASVWESHCQGSCGAPTPNNSPEPKRMAESAESPILSNMMPPLSPFQAGVRFDDQDDDGDLQHTSGGAQQLPPGQHGGSTSSRNSSSTSGSTSSSASSSTSGSTSGTQQGAEQLPPGQQGAQQLPPGQEGAQSLPSTAQVTQVVPGPFAVSNVQEAMRYLHKTEKPTTVNGSKCPVRDPQKAAEWKLSLDQHLCNLANKRHTEKAAKSRKRAKPGTSDSATDPAVSTAAGAAITTVTASAAADPQQGAAAPAVKKPMSAFQHFIAKQLKEMPKIEGESPQDRMKKASGAWREQKKNETDRRGS